MCSFRKEVSKKSTALRMGGKEMRGGNDGKGGVVGARKEERKEVGFIHSWFLSCSQSWVF